MTERMRPSRCTSSAARATSSGLHNRRSDVRSPRQRQLAQLDLGPVLGKPPENLVKGDGRCRLFRV